MKEKNRNGQSFYLSKRLTALILAAALCFASFMPVTSIQTEAATMKKWGVFLGACIHGNTSKVKDYNYIIIDSQEYTASEIKKLKSGGRKVYSYISIGSIEKYRSYYKRFKKYSLGNYDNWPGEKWIDVSKKAWQDFVVNELVPSMTKKGVDGLCVDNTDVYYEFHRTSIYNGLVNIITRLHKKKIPMLIDGGDVFVTKLINSGKAKIIDGVFQEEVLTQITDYDHNGFAKQTKADRTYYEAYLKKVKKAGLSVLLVEYTKKSSMRKTIIDYCKKHGYDYYISSTVALK